MKKVKLMTNQTMTTDELSDTRIPLDRRTNSLRSYCYSFFKRRRRNIRREEDKNSNLYVDVHETQIFVLFSLTILLSAIDAMLTLFIINNGGEEVNPVMNYLLNTNVNMFFWVKFFVTSFGMLFVVSHKHFLFYQTVRGYHIIYAIFATYFVLINYELYLISQILTNT